MSGSNRSETERPDADVAADFAARPEESHPWIGRVIDERYRIDQKLGEGGMGTVFVAEHLKLHKRVALKVILPEFAGDGEMAARFAREAMASARLDHPHVASALDYGTLSEGGAYLVMQLVRGKSLQAHLETSGAFSCARACSIGAQVADALAAAHAEGIVHRDLKPDNILLEPRDDGSELAKVLDFGIARMKAEDRPGASAVAHRTLTRLGTVMGTPGYMAPEQAMGDTVDHRTDLYALGVVLWEMLVGRPLFDGPDFTSIITRQLTEAPPSAAESAGRPEIPAVLDQMITRLLARAPGERPASAGEVRDLLRQVAYGMAVSEERPGIQVAALSPLTQTSPRYVGIAKTSYPTQSPRELAQTMLAAARTTLAATPEVVRRGARLLERRVRIGSREISLAVIAGALAFPLLVTVFFLGSDSSNESSASVTPTSEPSDVDAQKGVTQKIVELLTTKVNDAPPAPPPIAPEVKERLDVLLDSDDRAPRIAAARWLKQHQPADEVPPFALAVADFELARGCKGKRKVLAPLRELDDDRALPALYRIADHPRKGCGFLRLSDCYSCLRGELARTIRALRHEQGAEGEGEQEVATDGE